MIVWGPKNKSQVFVRSGGGGGGRKQNCRVFRQIVGLVSVPSYMSLAKYVAALTCFSNLLSAFFNFETKAENVAPSRHILELL